MNIFALINSTYKSLAEHRKISALRNEFLAMNDKVLADIGISRELLESGNKAYPWKALSDDIITPDQDVNKISGRSDTTAVTTSQVWNAKVTA